MTTTNRDVGVGAVFSSLVFFFALLFLWPNFVHEYLHVAALYAVGGVGVHVVHDFVFPVAPVVVWSGGVVGWERVFVSVFPSAVTVGVLFALWLCRSRGTLWSHVVLPVYLVFDVSSNVLTPGAPHSDFWFLAGVPLFVSWGVVFVVVGCGLFVVVGSGGSVVRGLQKGVLCG